MSAVGGNTHAAVHYRPVKTGVCFTGAAPRGRSGEAERCAKRDGGTGAVCD